MYMRTASNTLPVSIVAGVVLVFSAAAKAGEVNTGYFGNVAIKGYDPVAYFTDSRARKGSDDIAYKWLGAEWHFSSDQHRALFSKQPVKYAPQYGGYCADGVAYGDTTANIDPEAWRIIDGKLYLSYDPGSAAELTDVPGQLNKAEANWPRIREGVRETGE